MYSFAQFKQDDVVIIHLVTGAFIIGKYDEPKLPGAQAKLLRARAIQFVPRPGTREFSVAFAPVGHPLFTVAEAANLPIPFEAVLIAKLADMPMRDAYIAETTRILSPSAMGKLPGLGG